MTICPSKLSQWGFCWIFSWYIYSDCMLWSPKHTLYQMIFRIGQVNSSFEMFDQREFIKRILRVVFPAWFKSSLNQHFVRLLLQEAALHEKLHPHASVCVFHTQSRGSFHQGRGSVWCRGDGQLPVFCEYDTLLLLMALISLASVSILLEKSYVLLISLPA